MSSRPAPSSNKPARTTLTATAEDGCELQIYGQLPSQPTGAKPDTASPETALLFFPAMGTPGRAYARFSSALAGIGVACYVCDLRGTGDSGPPPSRANDFDYATYLYSDWPACIAAVRAAHPGARLLIGGHSIGAQLSLVYAGLHADANADKIAGLVLFTPNTSYYAVFPGWQKLRFWLWMRLIPIISRIVGYFPGDRLGFGGRNALGVIRDWSYTGRTGRFRDRVTGDLESAFARINNVPIAAISFTGDALAPGAATDHILAKVTQQPGAAGGGQLIERLRVETGPPRPEDHFQWMRSPALYLDWLRDWLGRL